MLRPFALLLAVGCGGTVGAMSGDVAATSACSAIAARYANVLSSSSCSMSMSMSMSDMSCQTMQRPTVMGSGNDMSLCSPGTGSVSEAGAQELDAILASYEAAGCAVAMCDSGMMTRE